MAFQLTGKQLDFLVLAALRGRDAYGYVLTQRVKALSDISDSTLYPVLRRLQKEGALSTYDRAYQNRNRHYYFLTEQGEALLAGYIREWERYRDGVDRILAGKEFPVQEEEAASEGETE